MVSETDLSPAKLFQQALSAHQQNNLPLALQIYQQVLRIQSDHQDSLYNIGLIYQVQKNFPQALESFKQILAINPDYVEASFGLGSLKQQQGLYEEAQVYYSKVLALKPDHDRTLYNLGTITEEAGDLVEASNYYQHVLEINPGFYLSHFRLAQILVKQEQDVLAQKHCEMALEIKSDLAECYALLGGIYYRKQDKQSALQFYLKALEFSPTQAEYYNNLGVVCTELGGYEQAHQFYQQALRLKLNSPQLYCNLANLYLKTKQFDLARQYYLNTLELEPRHSDSYLGLGNLEGELNNFQEALAFYQQALEIAPESGSVFNQIGFLHQSRGLVEQALSSFEQAFHYNPTHTTLFSNFFFCLRLQSIYNHQLIFERARQWNQQIAPSVPSHSSRKKQEKLRIGYVSPDFCGHSAAKVFGLLYKHHNRSQVEIYSYAHITQNDVMTQEFQQLSDHWREITYLSDAQVAQLIQADEIDILVDLAGHTKNNRLKVFSLRPAPLQVTGLGFDSTTGLQAMDYRFSDPYITPPELVRFNSEKIIYLSSLMRWLPPVEPVSIEPPPVLKKGLISFGSSHNLFKLNERTLQVWAKILQAVPQSQLFFKATGLELSANKNRLTDYFKGFGISAERLHFAGKTSLDEHLQFYSKYDIALDPFPYNGGVTTCETLWMGVPVITLAEGCRSGLSILSVLGLTELIAWSEEEYIQTAVDLAKNIEQLTNWRQALRAKIEQSILCNGRQFAQEVEQAYTTLWSKYES